MSRKPTSKRTRPEPKAVLRLPDLDQAKSAALNSLTSADAQRGYRRAIDEFVERYCSEPRLSAELLFSVIGFISKLAISLQAQSICGWEPCAARPTRLLIVVSLALIWLPAYDE